MSGATGRHTKYKPLFAFVARDQFARGATHSAVGQLLDVSERTIQRWIYQHKDFGKACEEGTEAFRRWQQSEPESFPLPPSLRPVPHDAGEPIIKVERIFVDPPVRDR